jgi:hypothetical protein
MIESLLLHAPGTTGVYDPRTNTAGLSFDLEGLFPDLFRPTPDNWRSTLSLLHEWAHFYQFATTSYGFLYQVLTFAQAYMVNGLLTIYDPRKRRCSLPLLNAGAKVDLKSDPHLRICYILENLRGAVYGYAPFPDSFGSIFKEWMIASEVLAEIFGAPRIFIGRVPDEVPISGAFRYRIDDLLESHAHALSCVWLMQILERDGLPRRITEELLEHANKMAVGPYRSFLKYELPVPEKDQMYAFCTLCDIALNPPGFHWETKAPVVHFPDRVWNPVERMWRYVRLTQEGLLPVPERVKPGFERDFLEGFKRALNLEGEYVLPWSGDPEHKLGHLRKKAQRLLEIKDVPQALSLTWLDRIETFSIASAVREQFPLILGGNNILDLDVLVRSVRGPVAISQLPSRTRFFPRFCTGLIHLGVLELSDVVSGEMLLRSGIAELEAISRLLHLTREEAEQVSDESVFMGENLVKFLEHYNLALDNFD